MNESKLDEAEARLTAAKDVESNSPELSARKIAKPYTTQG